MNDTTQNGASGVLRRRYIKDDPRRAAAVQTEWINAEIAQLIYDRRTAAGLTQKQLADLVAPGSPSSAGWRTPTMKGTHSACCSGSPRRWTSGYTSA